MTINARPSFFLSLAGNVDRNFRTAEIRSPASLTAIVLSHSVFSSGFGSSTGFGFGVFGFVAVVLGFGVAVFGLVDVVDFGADFTFASPDLGFAATGLGFLAPG